jgi:hypothetical protein
VIRGIVRSKSSSSLCLDLLGLPSSSRGRDFLFDRLVEISTPSAFKELNASILGKTATRLLKHISGSSPFRTSARRVLKRIFKIPWTCGTKIYFICFIASKEGASDLKGEDRARQPGC